MTTTQSVVDILVGEGSYREVPQPMKIGSVSFQFAHALVAEKRANDLVVVIELKSDTPDETMVRNILGLTRALDVLHSRRSVTAVLTSGQAAPETIRLISRVCRVLPIGTPTGPQAMQAVRDWLSVLLPLNNPTVVESVIDWESDLRKALPPQTQGTFVNQLIKAAPEGNVVVETTFADAVRASSHPALMEDGN